MMIGAQGTSYMREPTQKDAWSSWQVFHPLPETALHTVDPGSGVWPEDSVHFVVQNDRSGDARPREEEEDGVLTVDDYLLHGTCIHEPISSSSQTLGFVHEGGVLGDRSSSQVQDAAQGSGSCHGQGLRGIEEVQQLLQDDDASLQWADASPVVIDASFRRVDNPRGEPEHGWCNQLTCSDQEVETIVSLRTSQGSGASSFMSDEASMFVGDGFRDQGMLVVESFQPGVMPYGLTDDTVQGGKRRMGKMQGGKLGAAGSECQGRSENEAGRMLNASRSSEQDGSEGSDLVRPKQQRRDLSGRLAALVRGLEEAGAGGGNPRGGSKKGRNAEGFSSSIQAAAKATSHRLGMAASLAALGRKHGAPRLFAEDGYSYDRGIHGALWRQAFEVSTKMQPEVELVIPRSILQPSDSACVATRGVDRMRQQRLKALIVALAEACAERDQVKISSFLSRLDAEASPSGDPMQRCALHFRRAFQARANASGLATWMEPLEYPLEDIQNAMGDAMRVPNVRVGIEALVGVLSKAVAGAEYVHIICLRPIVGPHWLEIFQNLASHPNGPPKRIRMTGVEFPDIRWKFLPGGFCSLGGNLLTHMAAAFGIPFQFESILSEAECFDPNCIRIEMEETLAVASSMSLSLLPDESILRSNPRSSFLKWVSNHKPAVLLLMEVHASTTGPFFMNRIKDIIRSATSYFETLDVVLPRNSFARTVCEEVVARDIINCVACEGLERKVRYEVLEMWQHRMRSVGFAPMPLGEETWERLRNVTEKFDPRFAVTNVDEAARLSWCGSPTVAISAWF